MLLENSRHDTLAYVGHESEMGVLRGMLLDAFAGHGKLAMLVGEAGIGKTWIAHQLALHARKLGAEVFWGCCFEGDWQPAYGPWVEALSEFARLTHPDRLRRLLGTNASPLAQLIQTLRIALPDLQEAPQLEPDAERIRLYDAVVRFLLAVAEEAPLLLVIDDLQWADRDSLRLLRYLARSASRSRVLVLGVYREPELELIDENPLAELLPVLRREADYQQVNVQGFSCEDVDEYLARASGRPLPAGLVRAIYEETGGNPFYVSEVLRHLTEERKIFLHGGRWSTDLSLSELGIPEGVRQVVNRRLSRLSNDTNDLLRLAAGFTGAFEFSVLHALAGIPEEPLLDCLDEAIKAGLLCVVDGTPPSYVFAHAIVRHTIYSELNPDRRARLHRRIAQALELVYAGREGERAAELASQYRASAGLQGADKGLSYALLAAEQARNSFAHDRAASFLDMALELSREKPISERAFILSRLAIAQAEALNLEKAHRSVQEALAALDESGAEPREVAGFLCVAARALKEGGAHPSIWSPLVERGLAQLGEGRDLLWAQLMLLRNPFEIVEIEGITTFRWLGHDPQVVAIAREDGDEVDYARTLEPLDHRTRQESESVLALARHWKRPTAIIRALDVVGRDLLKRHGDHRAAAALYRELLEISERFGSIPGQAEALMQLAIIQTVQGELTKAKQLALRAREAILRLGDAHDLRFGITALDSLLAYCLDGDWPEITRNAVTYSASSEAARNPRGLVSGAYAALGYARMCDVAGVKRVLARLTPVIAQMEPIIYVHHAAITFGAAAAWEAAVSEYAAAYREMALGLIEAGFGDNVLSHNLTIARMSALLGRMDEANDYFQRARRECDANNIKLISALTDYDQALAFIRSSSSNLGDTESLLDAALAKFRSLGMEGWYRRAQSLQEELAVLSPPSTAAVQAFPDGLTAREVDVLRLLARGMTNSEIAQQLVLSIRTVERHIANIYNKIGAHNRSEATVYALRKNIT